MLSTVPELLLRGIMTALGKSYWEDALVNDIRKV